MIGHNIESVRGGLYNIRRFNQILERKDIILGDVLTRRGGDTDNNEVYKGYHFSRSIATDAKELIDIRNELVNTIEEDYALATFENIRTNCSNRSINKTDFEQFVKDKLAKTFKSYTKEKSLMHHNSKDIKHFKYLIIII
jgi:hypothetical protein